MPQPSEKKPLRVGILCLLDITDPNSLSGTPNSVYNALLNAGLEVIDLSPSANEMSQKGVFRRLITKIKYKILPFYQSTMIKISPQTEFKLIIKKANQNSHAISKKLQSNDVDILLALCMNSMLYALETSTPIIYASDVTARLVNTNNPNFTSKSDHYKEATDHLERTCLHKINMFIPAAQLTAWSAREHYQLPDKNVKIVEFGANIKPTINLIDPDAPTKNNIQLLLVASDPELKRLSFCIDVTQELYNRGWNASLNYIGPQREEADQSPLVNCLGRLMLSDPKDREIHQKTLSNSHWMILPSVSEAFGIAPCEAAHFGRPSIVSDVGGLPTVVKDQVSGLVLPIDASAVDYALAIMGIVEHSGQYLNMSTAALKRANDVLSWDVWAKRVINIIQEVLKGP